jgi:hypothetical protein
MVISFFSASKPIIALRVGCFPVVVILGTSEVFPGASMATVSFDRFIFLWAAEQKTSSSFVREFSDGRKRAGHIAQLILNPSSTPSDLWETI